MGAEKGIQQVQQMLLSQPRINAHEAFVQNSLSFAKPQNKTSTIGVLDLKDIQFITAQNQRVESPIITLKRTNCF